MSLWGKCNRRRPDGSATIVVADEVTGQDNSIGVSGLVGYTGKVGVFDVTVSSGITKGALGSTSFPQMALSSDVLGDAGTLTVKFSETDFNIDGTGISGFLSSLDVSKYTVGTPGTSSLSVYYDADNVLFATSTLIANFSDQTVADGYVEEGFIGAPTGPFSLTMVAEIFHAGDYYTSIDAAVSPVPEPTTMLLLGTGLVGLAGVSRRRKANKA